MSVGVMEDYKLRDLHVSHTLGWSWNLRWDPWYQGTRAPEPWALVPGIFLFYFIFYFGGSSFFSQKKQKKYCFLFVFSLFLSLFLSFSVHTLSVLLSLINFTNVFQQCKL